MKRNDWNKKRITFLYGKKNLILTLGICDLISKKPTCILSPRSLLCLLFLICFPYHATLILSLETHLDDCNIILTAKTEGLYLFYKISLQWNFQLHKAHLLPFPSNKIVFFFKWIYQAFNFVAFLFDS